jgi:hypothetical protein
MNDPVNYGIKLVGIGVLGLTIMLTLAISLYITSFNSLERSIRSINIPDEYPGVRNCWVEATAVRGFHDFGVENDNNIDPLWFLVPVSSIKIIEYLEDEGGVRYRRYFWGIPLDTQVYDC